MPNGQKSAFTFFQEIGTTYIYIYFLVFFKGNFQRPDIQNISKEIHRDKQHFELFKHNYNKMCKEPYRDR